MALTQKELELWIKSAEQGQKSIERARKRREEQEKKRAKQEAEDRIRQEEESRDKRSLLSKAWDTINPLDAGRSWTTANPSEEASQVSLAGQLGNLGSTFFSGTEKVLDSFDALTGHFERQQQEWLEQVNSGQMTHEEYQRRLDEQSRDIAWAGSEDRGLVDRLKKSGGTAIEAVSEWLPAGRAAGAATRGAKIGRGAMVGAGMGFGGGLGGELASDDEFSLENIGLSTALGSLMGGGAEALGGAFRNRRNARAGRELDEFNRPVDESAGRAADSLEAEDAFRRSQTEGRITDESRLLGDGRETMRTRLDEIDAELDAIRNGDPNTYSSNPQDFRGLAGEPVDDVARKAQGWSKNVEMVRTADLEKYAEFDRGAQPLSKARYEELKKDIAENGIQEPITLSYGAKDRIAAIGEGNHRLAIAKELGIEEIPVEVQGTQLSREGQISSNKGFADVPGREPDQFGYVPSNQTPSDIGVPGSSTRGATFAQDSPATISDASSTATRARELMRERRQITEQIARAKVAELPPTESPIKAMDTDPEIKKAVTQQVDQVDELLSKADPNYSPGLLADFSTPERIFDKAGLGDAFRKVRDGWDNHIRRQNTDRKQLVAWADAIGRDKKANERVFDALDGQNVKLQGAEQQVVDEARQVLKALADELGLPEEARISDYIPHLFDGKGKNIDPELAKLMRRNASADVDSPFLKKRLGAEDYKHDFLLAMDVYMDKASRQLNLAEGLDVLQKSKKQVSQSMANYINDQMNILKNVRDDTLGKKIEQSLSKIGIKEGDLDKGSGIARSMIYRATLGFNTGSALRNFTQTSNTYSKLGAKWTALGGAKAAKTLKGIGLDELVDMNVLDDSLTQAIKPVFNAKANKALRGADKALWWQFQTVEQINRATAYFGAKSKALAQGKTEAEAKKIGAQLARQTQFKFSAIDTPHALRGPIAKNLTQFMSFNIKQVEFLKDMFTGSEGMFQKSGKGFKLSAKGSWNMARLIGANTMFLYTVGNLIGMDAEDFIPFWSELSQGELPKSPMVEIGGSLLDLARGKDEYGNDEGRGELLKDFGADMFGLLVPGGTQAKKTYQGLEAVEQGGSFTDSGRMRFPLEDDASTRARAGIFGQYNTPAGQDYVAGGLKSLSDKQTEMVRSSMSPVERNAKFDFFENLRGLPTNKNDVADEVKSAIDNKDFERGRRLAAEHNARVDALISELERVIGDLPDEMLKYINSSYRVNYDYYRNQK